MTHYQVLRVHCLPAGDRAPFLAGLARRHIEALAEIGSQPRPAEPVSAAHQRRRHRREIEQLRRLGRIFGLVVPGGGDA